MAERKVERILTAREVTDGAGVRLHRIFGSGTELFTDPFLLLDDVGSRDPADYIAGFSLHPHRGIETVTYMLSGFFRHTDSLGNTGMLGPGCLQWMTAGSGIIHEEMPLESSILRGFQLWLNLPQSGKMKDPAYREVLSEEVSVIPIQSGKVKVLVGEYKGASGPIIGGFCDPLLLDVELEPSASIKLDIPSGRTAFLYVFEGGLAELGETSLYPDDNGLRALFLGDGDWVHCIAGDSGTRFLFAAANPIREPIAWKGPIVMNYSEEIDLAYKEYSSGTFVKVK